LYLYANLIYNINKVEIETLFYVHTRDSLCHKSQ